MSKTYPWKNTKAGLYSAWGFTGKEKTAQRRIFELKNDPEIDQLHPNFKKWIDKRIFPPKLWFDLVFENEFVDSRLAYENIVHDFEITNREEMKHLANLLKLEDRLFFSQSSPNLGFKKPFL
jgi:hypothetical protein